MNNHSENNSNINPPVINEFSVVVTAIKVVVLAIFLVPLAKYTFISKQDNENNASISVADINNTLEKVNIQENVSQNEELSNVIRKVIIAQPACPKSQILLILNEICTDILFKYHFCTPEDVNDPKKHKIPKYHARNKSNKDPKGKFKAHGKIHTIIYS